MDTVEFATILYGGYRVYQSGAARATAGRLPDTPHPMPAGVGRGSAIDDVAEGAGRNKLPANDSQIKHIFRDAKGHLPDTPANRSLIDGVGNNPKNFIGTDAYGTNWYAQIQPDGSQVWVRTYNGTVTNAGVNTIPIAFDPQTGLNFNPFR